MHIQNPHWQGVEETGYDTANQPLRGPDNQIKESCTEAPKTEENNTGDAS